MNKTRFSNYPRCWYIIYDNGSEFKLHFAALFESFGIKCNPNSVKNPQANAILNQVHQIITSMLHTTELDMDNTGETSDIDAFLTDAAWDICSTYHTVLKASLGAAVLGWDILFNIPLVAALKKIGEHRHHQTKLNME